MSATKYAIVAIAAVAVVAAAWLVWRFTGQPQAPEAAATGAPIVQVAVPALSGAAAAGKTIFDANCATCHGANAAGLDGAGPPLVHIVYEPNHHSDAAFHLAVQRGVRAHHWPFGNMPPVKGVGQEDVEKIVAYVRTLQRANGIN
jgi:mono/diheme cytochrome c family protein